MPANVVQLLMQSDQETGTPGTYVCLPPHLSLLLLLFEIFFVVMKTRPGLWGGGSPGGGAIFRIFAPTFESLKNSTAISREKTPESLPPPMELPNLGFFVPCQLPGPLLLVPLCTFCVSPARSFEMFGAVTKNICEKSCFRRSGVSYPPPPPPSS